MKVFCFTFRRISACLRACAVLCGIRGPRAVSHATFETSRRTRNIEKPVDIVAVMPLVLFSISENISEWAADPGVTVL